MKDTSYINDTQFNRTALLTETEIKPRTCRTTKTMHVFKIEFINPAIWGGFGAGLCAPDKYD